MRRIHPRFSGLFRTFYRVTNLFLELKCVSNFWWKKSNLWLHFLTFKIILFQLNFVKIWNHISSFSKPEMWFEICVLPLYFTYQMRPGIWDILQIFKMHSRTCKRLEFCQKIIKMSEISINWSSKIYDNIKIFVMTYTFAEADQDQQIVQLYSLRKTYMKSGKILKQSWIWSTWKSGNPETVGAT